SPAAAEARALIAACGAAAGAVAAREPLFEMVRADLTADEDHTAWQALARPAHPGAICVQVPHGSQNIAGAVLRLARMPSGPSEHVSAIWAASPSLCEQLIAAGLHPSRVAWLPPCVPTGSAGPGGEGILCILPGHDLERARHVIEAVAE